MRWDELARSYRRQVWLERAALRALLELLEIGPRERLLDVATGPAVLLEELTRRAAPPAIAVGIDSSAEMLARAPGLPDGWRLRVADARELPFEADGFDVATASYLLHVLGADERGRVITELSRVLRPGGRLGTITIAPPRGPIATWLSAPIRAAARRSEGRLAGLRPLDPARELAAAGFRELARRRTAWGYPSLCVAYELDPGPGVSIEP